MKNILMLVFMLLATQAPAQKLTGFYTGTLVNDSNRMVQTYELALSEYRGKVSGYAYVTFVSKDTFYYGIRRVKGRIENDNLVVTDDEFIANNFPESPAKGVKRSFAFPLNGADSVVALQGRWNTNRTKTYYAIPGKVELMRSSDSSNASLFRHLKELDMLQSATVAAAPAAQPSTKKKKEKIPVEKTVAPPAATVPVALRFDQRTKKQAALYESTADSLQLSFYDNGVIDGDSISVYVNGQLLLSGTKLTASATRRKIALPVEGAEILLVADNLGSLPPNTGLVVINDGKENYQLHFTADLQTNATIVIRRKKQ